MQDASLLQSDFSNKFQGEFTNRNKRHNTFKTYSIQDMKGLFLSTFKIAALYIPNHDHLFRLCNNSLCEITFWTADGEPVCRIYVTEVATRTILS